MIKRIRQQQLLATVILAAALCPLPFALCRPTDARALNSSRVPFLFVSDNPKVIPLVEQVGAIGMTVSDMDASIDFYSRVLSFEKVSDVEVTGEDYERFQGVFGLRMRVVRMRLGDELIELTEYLAPKGRPVPVDSRSNDRWFQHIAIITSDMDKAYTLLRQNKVEHASTGPQRLPDWNKNAGGIKAFYFRDPDKHWLEILQFPEGKGDAKWQRKERLFLGIDHTAIVVGNTEASLKFYRDVLGLHIAGTSENYGTEQEHQANRQHCSRALRGLGIGRRYQLLHSAEQVSGHRDRKILPALDLPKTGCLQRDPERHPAPVQELPDHRPAVQAGAHLLRTEDHRDVDVPREPARDRGRGRRRDGRDRERRSADPP